MNLDKTYQANLYEKDIYELWIKNNAFKADPYSNKPHYSIAMPPPNETGTLHVGHALFLTLQDILIRYHKLKGYDTLWVPGTDHAALSTNTVIEKKLAEQGINKHQIGREKFIKITKEFVGNSRNTIIKQIKAMGSATDWSRLRYTLDDGLSRVVSEVFVKMYNDGLIYRGNRIVNWDPKLETNVSDDEVIYKPEKIKLYTFKFGPFEISTTRPETKFGDKYVVVNPKDKRYAKYKHLQTFEAEWLNGKVLATVIKDASVDPNFGTGAMTITPWHSLADFELANKYSLDMEQIIGFDGKLLSIAKEFEGLDILKARPKIVKKLKEKGLLISVQDNYEHNIATNFRGGGIIEPQIRLQWFIDVNKKAINWKGQNNSFKEILQRVIREGDIKIIPKKFEKIYFNWIDNLKDWCLSRQIWWGHQLPVWYKDDKIYVGITPPKDEGGWKRDQDTLDTWFSSSLWTWSTLLDPKLLVDYKLTLDDIIAQSIDLKTYHPTNLLETGFDIIFFWVARMILATTYVVKEVPFREVFLHGLVKTEGGKKMSKSDPDTIIDPLSIIEEFGADALRLSLIQGLAPGQDAKVAKTKIITNRNFCNKLWNISRFIEDKLDFDRKPEIKSFADAWIIGNLNETLNNFQKALDNYQFSEAYQIVYHFLRDQFADWYVEVSKEEKNYPLLSYVYKQLLILTHPLAPFITEVLWQKSMKGKSQDLLVNQSYQKIIDYNKTNRHNFDTIIKIITEIRHIQKELNLSALSICSKSSLITRNSRVVERLARVKLNNTASDNNQVKLTINGVSIGLFLAKDLVSNYLNKLKAKQQKQIQLINTLNKRLLNKSYLNNAPAHIVNETKQKLLSERVALKMTQDDIRLFSDF